MNARWLSRWSAVTAAPCGCSATTPAGRAPSTAGPPAARMEPTLIPGAARCIEQARGNREGQPLTAAVTTAPPSQPAPVLVAERAARCLPGLSTTTRTGADPGNGMLVRIDTADESASSASLSSSSTERHDRPRSYRLDLRHRVPCPLLASFPTSAATAPSNRVGHLEQSLRRDGFRPTSTGPAGATPVGAPTQGENL